MHPSFERSLLRRTAVAFAAAAAILLAASPASALTVTLTGATGSSCTYTGMTVQPDGNVNVACDTGTVTPGAPGTISVSAPAALDLSTPTSATVIRSGGNTGDAIVSYSVSGACSTTGGGSLTFANGSTTSSQAIPVTTAATAGTCTITLTSVTGATPGTTVANITVSAPTTQPTINAACPAGFTQPANMLQANFQGLGQWWAQKNKSGQIVSIPLPSVATYSKQAAFGENIGAAYTPQPVTLEITISQCPGYIDVDTTNPSNTHPNNNYCNLKSPNGTYNQITWFGKSFSGLVGQAAYNKYGYCWAPEGDSNGPWYLNARWTFGSCPFGQLTCGFAIQQNLGPY